MGNFGETIEILQKDPVELDSSPTLWRDMTGTHM